MLTSPQQIQWERDLPENLDRDFKECGFRPDRLEKWNI